MVVASSNNGAVENVTRELPNVAKIADRFRNDTNDLKLLATQLLNLSIASDDGDTDAEANQQMIEAWGLISAVLGSKKNRNAFVNTLRATVEVDKPEPNRPNRKRRVLAPYNVFKLLEDARQRTNWNRARKEFRKALDEVRKLKDEIAAAEEDAMRIDRLRQTAAAAEEEVVRLEARLAQIGIERSKLDAALRMGAYAAMELENLRVARPGFFARLFNASSFQRWQEDWLAAMKKIREANLEERQKELIRLQSEEARINIRILEPRRECEAALGQADIAEKRRASAGGPAYVGFRDLRMRADAERQHVLPHSNDALQEARAVAFLKGMQIHLAFVTSTDGIYERNLKRALEMIDGKPELGPILDEAGPHLWETLFLIVPVISTTFASFSRTFRHLGAASIGWLFVDEAGQAVPQHAIGSLYRSRRALILGDPFQIEPVIMMDKSR
jgi:hypothetical protein